MLGVVGACRGREGRGWALLASGRRVGGRGVGGLVGVARRKREAVEARCVSHVERGRWDLLLAHAEEEREAVGPVGCMQCFKYQISAIYPSAKLYTAYRIPGDIALNIGRQDVIPDEEYTCDCLHKSYETT